MKLHLSTLFFFILTVLPLKTYADPSIKSRHSHSLTGQGVENMPGQPANHYQITTTVKAPDQNGVVEVEEYFQTSSESSTFHYFIHPVDNQHFEIHMDGQVTGNGYCFINQAENKKRCSLRAFINQQSIERYSETDLDSYETYRQGSISLSNGECTIFQERIQESTP